MSHDNNVTFHYGLQQRVENPAPPRAGTSRQPHYFFPPHSRVSSESLPLSRQLLPTSWSWHESERCLLSVSVSSAMKAAYSSCTEADADFAGAGDRYGATRWPWKLPERKRTETDDKLEMWTRGSSQLYTAHLWRGASREPGHDKGIVCTIPESISTQGKRAHPRPALPFLEK